MCAQRVLPRKGSRGNVVPAQRRSADLSRLRSTGGSFAAAREWLYLATRWGRRGPICSRRRQERPLHVRSKLLPLAGSARLLARDEVPEVVEGVSLPFAR